MWVSTQFISPSHPPHLHSALTCWLHSPCCRRRQKLPGCDSGGHGRPGPVGLRTAAVGRDRDTQEAWTVHSMVGSRARPDRANRSSRGELFVASPNRPSRSQDGGVGARMRRHSLARCNCKSQHLHTEDVFSSIHPPTVHLPRR